MGGKDSAVAFLPSFLPSFLSFFLSFLWTCDHYAGCIFVVDRFDSGTCPWD